MGWVPLAPFEPYYAHRYWGPGVTVAVGLPGISINIGGLAWLGHAVIVPHGHFYGGHGYGGVRVTNINRTTIINNYNTSPVVNNRVISNYNTLGAKYAVTNTAVTNRPAPGVVNRIQRNQDIARRTGAGITAQSVTRGVNGARAGTLQRTAAVDPPRVTSKMSTAGGAGTQGCSEGPEGKGRRTEAERRVHAGRGYWPDQAGTRQVGSDRAGHDRRRHDPGTEVRPEGEEHDGFAAGASCYGQSRKHLHFPFS